MMTRHFTSVDHFLGDVWDTRDLLELLGSLDPDDDDDEREEFERATALAAEVEPLAADYLYGEGVIADSYFTEYARELADDIGAVSADASWPNTDIDWDAAADALKQDYSSFEFEGVTYWVR